MSKRLNYARFESVLFGCILIGIVAGLVVA